MQSVTIFVLISYFHLDDIAENLTEDPVLMYVQMLRNTFEEVQPTHDSKVGLAMHLAKACNAHC